MDASQSMSTSISAMALRTVLGLSVALGLPACGSAPPSPELVSARATYEKASESQAKELVPDQLLSARQALEAAESEFNDDENSTRARTLAYIAQRKALIAMAGAGIMAAKKMYEEADREYRELLETVAKTSRDRLGKTQNELSKEREARADVEKRLSAAMKSLEEIAKVKEDSRGTVITLSGSVLFKTNAASLLPIAEQQLRKVAEALNAYDEDRKIVVAGHTDSRGSSTSNRRLSLARAESVRAFLVNSGVSPDRISASGRGEDEPVADNRSAEGRANNRRVEIIVEGKQASSSPDSAKPASGN
ncbi:MAG TPA: OmpA family protein [Kofleriaceae bacterium]|nr:OmpA family protein [Kofleriaceae bacterium]